jgi:hypothetical protein
MTTGRITKRGVDALRCKAGKDRTFLWDKMLAGFGVVCFPTGKKVYVTQFRANGRSRRIAIGEHGRLTPDEARSEAKKLLGAIESGADPIAQRRAARAARTLRRGSQ